MKNLKNSKAIIRALFYVGLLIKAVDAVIEFIGGFLLLVLSHSLIDRLIQLIAYPERIEDQNDVIMNYFISISKTLSVSSQHAAAIYMLLHGTIKLAVIWLLFKKKLWAYPLAAIVFTLLIAYEIYSFAHSLSLIVLPLIVIDTALVIVILLEYKRLQAEISKNA